MSRRLAVGNQVNPLTHRAVLVPNMNDSILHIDYLRDGGRGGCSSDNPRALFDDGGIAGFAKERPGQPGLSSVAALTTTTRGCRIWLDPKSDRHQRLVRDVTRGNRAVPPQDSVSMFNNAACMSCAIIGIPVADFPAALMSFLLVAGDLAK